jgi:hypothetical protein
MGMKREDRGKYKYEGLDKPQQVTNESKSAGAESQEPPIRGGVRTSGQAKTGADISLKRAKKVSKSEAGTVGQENRWTRDQKLMAFFGILTIVTGIVWGVVAHFDATPSPASIDVKQIDFTEPIIAGKPTLLRADFVNSGGSPAFDIRPKLKISRLPIAENPDYDLPDITGSTGTIGPKLPFDVPGAMRAIPQDQIDAINSGKLIVYVTADIAYSDTSGSEKRHHKYFCVQYQPSSEKMVGCKNQRASS